MPPRMANGNAQELKLKTHEYHLGDDFGDPTVVSRYTIVYADVVLSRGYK